LVFFKGSLRSGIETGRGVREKEREIFPFATGLVSVEILHPDLFLPSLRGRCKKGRGGEGRGEKNGGREFPSFCSLPNLPPFSSPRLLLLTLATLALFTIHLQHKARIEK